MTSLTEHARWTVVVGYGSPIGPFEDWESADAFRLAHAPDAEVTMLWTPADAIRTLL